MTVLPLPQAGTCVTCSSSTVILQIPIEQPCEVSLAISENGTPIYQRNYGWKNGTFSTDTLYLRLTGAQTLYSVTLTRGSEVSSFSILRQSAGLRHAQACSAGLSLQLFTGRDTFETITMLDLSCPASVADVNFGGYRVGLAIFTISSNLLTVSFAPESGIQLEDMTFQLAYLSGEAAWLGQTFFPGQSGTAGIPILLHSTGTAAVYVRATVSGTVSNLPAARLDEPKEQQVLLDRFLNESVALPNG